MKAVLRAGVKVSPLPWPKTPWGILGAWFREFVGTRHKMCGGNFMLVGKRMNGFIEECDRCGQEMFYLDDGL